ncbi:hypothetical protein ROZALSC1DRAFT_31212 [Rozella allomycis CSF55]|uniref:Uncharacterized protein n=1 Tax=Rozella allomycis (strain CSF55) TaxID=988480 RepID=A0A4P9YCU2_ROZAC|nr:hypothetical protein ROZALSC1DRAFT_31212 [Rozella allomycis CSF55]
MIKLPFGRKRRIGRRLADPFVNATTLENIMPRAEWSEDMDIELVCNRYEESNIKNVFLKAPNTHNRNQTLLL